MDRIPLDLYPNCPVAIYIGLYTEMLGNFVEFTLQISFDMTVDFLLYVRRRRTQNTNRAGFQNYYEHRMMPLTDVCSQMNLLIYML